MAATEPADSSSAENLERLEATSNPGELAPGELATAALTGLASLRLTVVLLASLMFLVFVGTLAQVDHGIWYVVDHSYFRVWLATVELQTFERFVQMFAPIEWNLAGAFPFPGGYTIGTLMAINLLSAHRLRFKVTAKGNRLSLGLAVVAIGALLTWLVIRSGMDNAIESELSPDFCNILWHGLRASLLALALAGAYTLLLSYGRIRRVEWSLLLGIVVLLAGAIGYLLINPDIRLDSSGLRILWQLLKGGVAGGVLLVGCAMVFGRRAGIVLLHGGVLLLMFSEMWTGYTAHESNMTIFEGQTANYSYDTRHTELAIIDSDSSESEDKVAVIPATLLQAAAKTGKRIVHVDLPFDLEVSQFLSNSQLRELAASDTNLADAGAGKRFLAENAKANSGVSMASGVDMPSVYARLFKKGTDESLGTYLFSTAPFMTFGAGGPRESYLAKESIEAGTKPYSVSLRFARHYKPYTITLIDFSNDTYAATNKTRNYSSDIRLQDSERNVDHEVRIWMNNPLRYRGETFYQASFDENNPIAATVLQVVTNPGWMMPYVACMLVGVGMLAHFWPMILRFVRRRTEQASRQQASDDIPAASVSSGTLARWFPLAMLLLFGGYVGGKARMPDLPQHESQIHQFGKLPVQYQGRIQPLDTVARNALQIFSGRQEVEVFVDGKALREKLPAIRWLLDVISDAPTAREHCIFRIDNLELLDVLKLERRPGSFRYSLADLAPALAQPRDENDKRTSSLLDKQNQLARSTPKEQRSLYQRKVLELFGKLNNYYMLRGVFSSPRIRAERDHIMEDMQVVNAQIQSLHNGIKKSGLQLIHAIPPTEAGKPWMFLLDAEFQLLKDRVLGKEVNPATVAMTGMLQAFARDDAGEFNKRLYEYNKVLGDYEQSIDANLSTLLSQGKNRREILNRKKVDFEVFFNQFSPFYYAAVLYFVAFVLAAFSWLGWSGPLEKAANWLIQFTFVLHTLALVGRIYISGRPPVTNLYSSAIFIGWACVLAGLILEALYRWGIGNMVASVTGFLTLVIAYNLSLDGDTFVVLQAVLDTQFWLATHVVCITLGYAATFLAGFLGMIFIVRSHLLGSITGVQRQQLTRMIYGTLCFAIFFSFIGTVLGGLWADDSWGRFWGWDPKENGALIIVLWNALVLHARWGALVGPKGLACLAIGGNIVTSWSWFGVNELGVGLHAYGGSETSTTTWLLAFAVSQLLLIALGMLPGNWFRTGGRLPSSRH